MRSTLRWLAIAVSVVVLTIWAGKGASTGWTKNQLPVKTTDDVTGIEGTTYERKFVPGLDFLGAGLLGAGALAGASLFLSRKTQTKN